MTKATNLNRFLIKNPENADLNQYWYSPATIKALAEEIDREGSEGTAFLSTPSLYFSVSAKTRKCSKVFDLDDKWKEDPGFVLYDFNHPENIPKELHHRFEMVVIDPPFITREVWEKYATAAKILLRPVDETRGEGKVLASTIAENASLMTELLGLQERRFKPSIPNLVYQYSIYTNYPSSSMEINNLEVPSDDG